MNSDKDSHLNKLHGHGPCLLIWLPVYSMCVCVCMCKSEWEGDTVPCPCGPSRCTSVHMWFWSHTHLAYPGQDRVASHETPSRMIAHQIHVCCKDEKEQDSKLRNISGNNRHTRTKKTLHKNCIQARTSNQSFQAWSERYPVKSAFHIFSKSNV